MPLYTGKGDQGTTKLFDSEKGVRLSKSSVVFEALGTLDECNSYVGLCKAKSKNSGLKSGEIVIYELLHTVQDHLFSLQAEVAGAPKTISQDGLKMLEESIGVVESFLPEIKTFFVPGSSELSSHFDIARTITRRAERCVVAVSESGTRAVSAESLAYLNRLSSLMYALARYVAHVQGLTEQPPIYE